MKSFIKFIFPLILILNHTFVQADVKQSQYENYVGLWQTIDEDTHKPRSIVDVYVEDGKLKGKIIKFYPKEDEPTDPSCEKCKGDLHNQKIVGMLIIDDMEWAKGQWKNGEILDPNNGKTYDCKIWIEDDILKVRGYAGFFFRTQDWFRYNADSNSQLLSKVE